MSNSGHRIPRPAWHSKRAQLPSIPMPWRCGRNQPVESMSGSSSSPQCILFPCTFQGLLWENGSVLDSPSSAPSVSPRELAVAEMHKMWGPWRGWRWWRWGFYEWVGGWSGGGQRLQRSSGGKARAVKMFADVSWERGWFYRSPDGGYVIDRLGRLMNGFESDGDVARLTGSLLWGCFE